METMILLIPIFLLFIDKNMSNKNNKKTLFIVIFLFILLYSAFREYFLPDSMIGVDYYSYQSWFYNTNEINGISNIGFNLLILFVKLFFNNYIVFVCIVNFIMLFNFFKFSIDNSSNYQYSIYLFITFGILSMTFNGLRQCMACSFWLLGFKYLYQEKGFFKYMLFTVIASTFHNSAIALLFLYPLLNIKIKILYRIVTLFITSIFLKSDFAIKYILDQFSVIDDIYVNRYYGTENISSSNLVVFSVALVILAAIILGIKNYDKDNKCQNIKLNYLLLLVFVGFIAPYHLIYSRMLFYFMPAVMLSVPDIFKLYNKETLKVIKVASTVMFLIMYFI